jgi:TATA-box binding protein (TBP) (component of TFIID and TFIIIB)
MQELVNVVGSANIGQKVDLKQVTLALEGAEYNPKELPASFTVPKTRRRCITLCIGKNGLYWRKEHR